MKKIIHLSLIVIAFCFASISVQAEQKKVFGDYEIHYIVLNSTFLKPETAKAYGLKRSKNLGYVSISVLKNDAKTGIPKAVNADIELVMANLIGQKNILELTRIEESGAIYYLNTFTFFDEDIYNFKLKAKPEGQLRSFDFRFNQKLYAEEFNQNVN